MNARHRGGPWRRPAWPSGLFGGHYGSSGAGPHDQRHPPQEPEPQRIAPRPRDLPTATTLPDGVLRNIGHRVANCRVAALAHRDREEAARRMLSASSHGVTSPQAGLACCTPSHTGQPPEPPVPRHSVRCTLTPSSRALLGAGALSSALIVKSSTFVRTPALFDGSTGSSSPAALAGATLAVAWFSTFLSGPLARAWAR